MGSHDARVDAYIARSAEFARPILTYLREVVHAACPDVEETIRWGMPSFTYHGLLGNMAAFKAHATFSFWKGSLVVGGPDAAAKEAMGQFGRITSVKELPPRKVLAGYVKEAMRLNRDGVKVARPKRAAKPAPRAPADLLAALRTKRKALTGWQGLPPSHQREYVEWITEAKTAPTRAKRIDTAVTWIADGKSRNWKYERK